MKFIANAGPFIRDKDNTHRIMNRLMLALFPIILFAFFKNGIIPFTKGSITIYEAVRPLLMILAGIIGSFIIEFLYYKIIQKRNDIFETLSKSHFIFPGLFLALILPLSTPLYIVFIGALIANLIGKLIFGGFGHNIFNPALVGYIIIISVFGIYIFNGNGYLNGYEADTISAATPLTKLNSLGHIGTYMQVTNDSMVNQFLGFTPGAIGEVSRILILIAFIYLALTKTIKWRIPVFYIGTVFLMTLIIGLDNNMGLWYPLFNVIAGGLLFGAVFMATDPVTSPITYTGQFIYALLLGIVTVTLRYVGPYAEGVATSILVGNMLNFIVDRFGVKARLNLKYKIIVIITMLLIAVGTSILISNQLKNKPKVESDFNVISTVKQGDKTIYNVSNKGFSGNIIANITYTNNQITSIDILECNDTYFAKIIDAKYTDYLISKQSNINDADTISGATSTSNKIKTLVRETINYHKG